MNRIFGNILVKTKIVFDQADKKTLRKQVLIEGKELRKQSVRF